MQKKFIYNLALVLLLNLLIKPFYILGIDAEILKQVELNAQGSYGLYFSLLGLTFIGNIFLDLGIINFNTRNIAQHSQLLSKHFSGIFTLRLLLTIVYLIILLLIGLFFNYSDYQLKILTILGFNQILVAFTQYFRSNLAGLLRFKEDSILSVLDRLLLIIICSTLLWGGITNTPFKIEWFIYAQTIAYGITCLLGFLLVLRQTKEFSFKWEFAFSIMILKRSFPFALLILLMAVYYYSDAVMLERIHPNGNIESAAYARGYRFFMAANMIGYIFAGLLLPIFSKLLKNNERVDSILILSLKFLLGISVTIGLTGFCFQNEIIHWRYEINGEDLQHSANAFGYLMLSFIAISTTYIFGTLLTAKGALKHLNILAFFGVIINIVLNFIMIPESGAEGAALASLITQALTALFQVIIALKLLKISVALRDKISFSLFFILSYCVLLIVPFLSFSWIISLLITFSSLVIISFSTGMISIKYILAIINEKSKSQISNN
jgi:O-antigen/teichoic acid export membrane protein